MTIVYWILFFLILYVIWKVNDESNKVVQVRDHWQHYFENEQFSSQEFYKAIDIAIREREIISLQTSRIEYAEGNILSANREYLRISRGTIVFDICAAPFAKGFFISAWQGELPNLVQLFVTQLPLIGKSIERAFYRKTYFQIDSEQMYITAVHSCFVDVIEQMTKVEGVRTHFESEQTSPGNSKITMNQLEIKGA